MRMLATWLLGTSCLLGACAHEAAATQAAPASPTAVPSATAAEPAAPDRAHHMDQTFWDAVDARDALVFGDLELAKTAARRLRDRDFRGAFPDDWKLFVGDIQLRADELAMAPDLDAASAALGKIALACGSCHWFAQHGPAAMPEPRVTEPAPGEEELLERMDRHAVAAEQLWDGLTVPSDDAWYKGTLTFTRAPLAPPREQGIEIDSREQMRIENIRGLARQARVASSHGKRAELYGELVARCGHCHYTAR
jgi:soluble cytochrome b562